MRLIVSRYSDVTTTKLALAKNKLKSSLSESKRGRWMHQQIAGHLLCQGKQWNERGLCTGGLGSSAVCH